MKRIGARDKFYESHKDKFQKEMGQDIRRRNSENVHQHCSDDYVTRGSKVANFLRKTKYLCSDGNKILKNLLQTATQTKKSESHSSESLCISKYFSIYNTIKKAITV